MCHINVYLLCLHAKSTLSWRVFRATCRTDSRTKLHKLQFVLNWRYLIYYKIISLLVNKFVCIHHLSVFIQLNFWTCWTVTDPLNSNSILAEEQFRFGGLSEDKILHNCIDDIYTLYNENTQWWLILLPCQSFWLRIMTLLSKVNCFQVG